MAEKDDKLSLLRAYLGDDKEQIKEMLELFLKNIPNDLADLTLFCKAGDTENIWRAAHRIKSSVRFFGIIDVAEKLQQMESMAKENPKTIQLKNMASQVNLEMEHELKLLQKELSAL